MVCLLYGQERVTIRRNFWGALIIGGERMTRIRLTGCALTLFFMVACLPVFAGQQTSQEYCSARGAQEVYFTAIFTIPRLPDKSAMRNMQEDFVEFVKTKYSVHDISASCGDAEQKSVEETNAKEQKKKMIETGWKPASFPSRNGP
jgi:hypothetical protein